MSDREILLHWLARAAVRLRWRAGVPELGRLACALAALIVLAQAMTALGVPEPVRSALFPLLLMAGLAFTALSVWRLRGPATLEQAAAAADTQAGLSDELKSAHWFAQRGTAAETATRNALIDLLLARAARTVQALDAQRLFPLGLPRSALGALMLAGCATALAWVSPPLSLPETAAAGPAAVAARTSVAIAQARSGDADELAALPAAPEAPARADAGSTASQAQRVAQQLPAAGEEDRLGQAAAVQDAQLTAQFLQALQRERADAARRNAAAGTQADEIPAETPAELLAGLQEAARSQSKPRPAPQSPAAQPTARIRQQLREQGREEQRKLEGTPAQGEVTLNPRLRAVNRNSVTTQEMAQGFGQAAEAGSQTSVDGTPMGPREGKSRAGGSSGEDPQTNPTGDIEAEPVLGAQPVRLEVQLMQVRVERNDEPQQQATEEEFYAETQRQAARVDYESVAVHARSSREAAVPQGETPVGYREAVKRYFLSRHGRED